MAWVKMSLKDSKAPVYIKSTNICACFVNEAGTTMIITNNHRYDFMVDVSLDEIMNLIAKAEKHKIEGVK